MSAERDNVAERDARADDAGAGNHSNPRERGASDVPPRESDARPGSEERSANRKGAEADGKGTEAERKHPSKWPLVALAVAGLVAVIGGAVY